MSDLSALDFRRRRCGGCKPSPFRVRGGVKISASSFGSATPSYDSWSDVRSDLSNVCDGITFTRMFDPVNKLKLSRQDCCPIAVLPILVKAFDKLKLEEMGLERLIDIKSLEAGAREVPLSKLAIEANIAGSGGELVVLAGLWAEVLGTGSLL